MNVREHAVGTVVNVAITGRPQQHEVGGSSRVDPHTGANLRSVRRRRRFRAAYRIARLSREGMV